jgi:hypothetical protein
MDSKELASSIAFVVFSQAFGPTIAMTFYNIIFLESLRSQLRRYAPDVSATTIINAGATGFRSFTQPADLPGVLKAYATAIDRVFYLAAAFACVCGVFCWGMGWRDLRKKKGGKESVEEGKTVSVEEGTDGDRLKEEGKTTPTEAEEGTDADRLKEEGEKAGEKAV